MAPATGAATTIDSYRYRTPRSDSNDGGGERALRMAPLYLALMIVMAVPIILLSISEDPTSSSSIHVRDDRPGGAWVPSTKPIKTQSQNRRPFFDQEPQVQLQTPTARCELHHLDNHAQILVLEPTYSQVLVAVVDDAGGWMIQNLSSLAGSSRQLYALPTQKNTKIDKSTTKFWSPLIGNFLMQNGDDDDTSPWQIALETVNAAIGILDERNDYDERQDSQQQQLVLDDYGLPDGRVPSSKEDSWKFLGRHRTMARHGGGFVYAYLYHGKITHQLIEATASTNPSILHISTEAIQNGLQNGDFVDLGAVATISLALQRYLSEKTEEKS